MRLRPLATGFALLALTGIASCSAAFDGRVYRGNGYAFQVSPAPNGWEPIGVSHTALAYRDVAADAVIAVNGRCDRDGDDVPLRSLTQHLFIQFTDRKIESEEVMPFDGREALRTDASAKLDGVERRFVLWVMKKDRCVYDLMYLSTPARFASGVETFDAWVRGFSALPRGDE